MNQMNTHLDPETMTDAQAQELADWMDKLATECTCVRDDRPCEGLIAGGLCDDCDHSDWDEGTTEVMKGLKA